MISITKAQETDSRLLADIGRISFIESHGHSAAAEDINSYADEKYTYAAFKAELADPDNVYHIIFYNGQPAGYSKIIFNVPYSATSLKNTTKLERLYLLKEFYGLKLGLELLNFNISLSKLNQQSGMWLYTWKGNDRAVGFYSKAGFKVIGDHDFKISDNHSNPNYQMLLTYV